MKKFRNNLIKQAFDRYVRRVRELKQDDINADRMGHLIDTFRMRQKRRVFNAMLVYKNRCLKSKVYMNIVLTKLNIWDKRRAFSTWQKNAHKTSEEFFNGVQDAAVEELAEINHELGELTVMHEEKVKENKQLDKNHRKQGQRVLSNYFARYFYVNETRGFEKWKEYVVWQKHKETIMKRYIEHWHKHKTQFLKSVFENWAKQCKLRDLRSEISRTKQLAAETAQVGNHN